MEETLRAPKKTFPFKTVKTVKTVKTIIFKVVLGIILIGIVVSLYLLLTRKHDTVVAPIPDYPRASDNFLLFEANFTGTNYIWFDLNLPACLGSSNCTWQTTPMKAAYYLTADGPPPFTEWEFMRDNVVKLEEGHSFKIAMLRDSNGDPAWFTNGAAVGTGVFITNYRPTAAPASERIEYNFNFASNGGVLYYDLSCVDSINLDVSMTYESSSSNCSLGACPEEFTSNDGRCLAPKWNKDGTPNNDQPLYGCPYGDSQPNKVCECRQFWLTDPKAIRWKTYINGNGNPNWPCSAYAWAYDELVIQPGDSNCSNAMHNPAGILRAPQFVKGGVLKIKINSVN